MTRLLLAFGLALTLVACSKPADDAPAVEEAAAPAEAPVAETTAPLESNPLNNLYWGDTHLHTSYSPDAYLMQNRSERDRRSVRIHATEKGQELCNGLREMEMRHASSISVEPEKVDAARDYLRGLERVWSDSIQFGGRG